MKLFDKIKDLFTDTEEIEEDITLEEELKEEYRLPKEKLPKVMQDVIDKEEKSSKEIEVDLDKKLEIKSEELPKREEKKFSFPINFEEEFEIKNKRPNVLEEEKKEQKPIKELYSPKNVEPVREKSKFKASPVISPVYGILDKNYTKEEIKEKSEELNDIKRQSKKVDFETVRKKAFGNLTDDIKDNLICENCELYKEVKRISSLREDDLLYDMTVDNDKKEELTIEKAYDNYEDFGVSYEPNTHRKDNIETEEVNIVNHNDDKPVAEEIEVKEIEEKEEIIIDKSKQEEPEKEELPTRSKKKDEEINDEFFKLIDSMYEEREEGNE